MTDPSLEIRLALSKGQIHGSVVGGKSLPVADATVTLKHTTSDPQSPIAQIVPLSVGTTQDGGFVADGLQSGNWEITARKGREVSDPQVVRLAPSSTQSVRLVLEPTVSVSGLVLADSGDPIPGAAGFVFREPSRAGETGTVRQFHTDLQGRFQVEVGRPGNHWAQFVVVSAGRSTVVLRQPLEDREIRLVVPSSSGEVRVLLNMVPGIDGLAPPPFNLYALANETGATLPLTQALALRGAILTPREKTVWVVFPRLSEGRWRLLRFANLEHGLAYLAGAAAPANSETFWVKANEVATVTPRW